MESSIHGNCWETTKKPEATAPGFGWMENLRHFIQEVAILAQSLGFSQYSVNAASGVPDAGL